MKKPLSRVLCAVDIDERSNQVYEHTLAVARSTDAKRLILHAVSPAITYSNGATKRVALLSRLRSRAIAAGVRSLPCRAASAAKAVTEDVQRLAA